MKPKLDEQQLGESDKRFLKRWKEHDEEERHKPKLVWLQDALDKQVHVYCHRSPSVQGIVRKVDLRFGKVLVENEHEIVEINMSEIAQVRYPK